MIDPDVRFIITPELGPGESLIWASQPQKFPITIHGVIYLLLILTFGITMSHIFFDAFIASAAWRSGEFAPESVLLFPALFIVFVLMILGNLIRDFLMPMKQVYGLTQTRGIIVSKLRKKHVVSLSQSELASRTRAGGDKIGTLAFRVEGGSYDNFQRLLFSFDGIPFYNIPNPKDVERLIQTEILGGHTLDPQHGILS